MTAPDKLRPCSTSEYTQDELLRLDVHVDAAAIAWCDAECA